MRTCNIMIYMKYVIQIATYLYAPSLTFFRPLYKLIMHEPLGFNAISIYLRLQRIENDDGTGQPMEFCWTPPSHPANSDACQPSSVTTMKCVDPCYPLHQLPRTLDTTQNIVSSMSHEYEHHRYCLPLFLIFKGHFTYIIFILHHYSDVMATVGFLRPAAVVSVKLFPNAHMYTFVYMYI